MQDKNDEIEIDLTEVIGLVIHRLWILIICAILAGVIGFAISYFLITPKFQSTTKIIVLNKQDSSTITYSDLQLASQLTKDYEELITCRYVLEQVIEQCELEDTYEELYSRVTVENTKDTRIIGITVEDASPENAQYIADNIREVAANHIQSVTDVAAVNVVDYANIPTKKSSPSIKKWTAGGAAIGFLLALCAIIVEYILDDTIKSSEDIEKYLGYTTLALIPVMQPASKSSQSTSKRQRTGSSDFSAKSGDSVILVEPEDSVLQSSSFDSDYETGRTSGIDLDLEHELDRTISGEV